MRIEFEEEYGVGEDNATWNIRIVIPRQLLDDSDRDLIDLIGGGNPLTVRLTALARALRILEGRRADLKARSVLGASQDRER